MSVTIHVCDSCKEEFSNPVDFDQHPCVEDQMKNGKVFSFDFLEEMKDYLMAGTKDDLCVTRTKLCADLKLDSKLDSVIGAIINLHIIPGFKIYMGPNGGIGRVDRQSTKKTREDGYTIKLSDSESARILSKLEDLLGGGLVVSRKKIAGSLGDSGTKIQNKISAALKLPEFSDFATKNGKNGGVYKVSKRPDITKRVSAPIAAVSTPVTPVPVPEESDLSGPLDRELEHQTERELSPLERKWARAKQEKIEAETKSQSDTF